MIEQKLEITRRLLGSSAIVFQEQGEREITVKLDVEGFVRRLLLFDTYVLYSVRLKEIPEMVRHFGYEGTLALLSSGSLEIRCECTQFMEGQFNTPKAPWLTFQFHVIEAHGRDQYLINNLSELNRIPVSSQELMVLKSAVVKAVRQPDNATMFRSIVAPAFDDDLVRNSRLVKQAVRFVLAKEKGIHEIEFKLLLHKVGDDRYEAETDLPQKFASSAEEIHYLLKSALLGVAEVNQRLGEMNVHTALSGFTTDEVPLFQNKLEGIADAVGSARSEDRFQRVVTLAGFPEFPADIRIDIEQLLRIRNEPEALEFRSWLSGTDKFSDREIQDRVASFTAKLGLSAQRTIGKLVRIAVTTAIGFLPPLGVAVGPLLGILDAFAWDMFARRSGIAAFVNETYPSLFDSR